MNNALEVCEIKRGMEWERIGIAEALDLRGERFRCAACHGRVLTKEQRDEKPHFVHLLAFAYCSGNAASSSPLHPGALI